MILYILAAAAGLLLGLVTTRKTAPLLLTRVRCLYLLIPATLAALAPLWLDRTEPGRIWTDDRQMLVTLILIQQCFLILFLVINLLPRHLPMPHVIRVFLRRQQNAVNAFFSAALNRSHIRLTARRVTPEHRPATRWWHRIPLLVILAAVLMQTDVLVRNNGYMPLTREYLADITNPALIAGIENGALLMKRIVDSNTVLPQLAQAIRLPLLEQLFPEAFPFYGPAQLLGAAGLFLFLFSQFFDEAPQ